MSYPERLSRGPFDFPAALGDIGIGMGPSERTRRLLPDAAVDRVAEFYSSRVGGRLLAVPRESHDGHVYTQLAERRLPVFDEANLHQDFLFLYVPLGAHSLRSRLHLIRRDLESYGGILTDIVATQRRQYDAHLGVMAPGELSLFDHFALVDDRDSASGKVPYLIPPYTIDREGTPETFAVGLMQELYENDFFKDFTGDQVAYVRTLIETGVSGGPAS